jgi:hypothetical protein
MDAFYDVYGSPPAIPATELQEWVDMRYDHVMHPELVDDGGYNLARPEPVVKASDVQQILIIYTESFAGNDMHNTHINTSDDTIIVDAFNNSIDVYVDSDADGYTYPTITIMTGSVGGDIEIVNLSEKVYPYLMNSYRRFRLNTEPDTEYVIDSSINSYSPLGINVISGEFPRLLNGKNVLFFSGNLKSAKIEWRNRRYL